MKHDQIRHLRSLRLLLSQNKSPLGFLLAAGCPLSVRESGVPLLPDMAGLTKIIQDAHATDTATTPYKRLITELGKAGKDISNLEDVLTYIRSMKEVSTGGGTVRGFTEEELKGLETEICSTIADAVSKDLPNGDNSYRRFARWVSSIDRLVPVEIFTTNYDLLLEQALEEQCVPFFDGFAGSRFPFFDIHSVEENELPTYWARLWKLHGSVNWKSMPKGFCRVSKGIAGSPELIYPSKLKYDQSRKMPFLAMSDRLTNFLLKPHAVLFVCGYSFGDEHINDSIINALKINQSSNVVALMYGKMKGDTSGKLVAPEAVKIALERPNLSIWHDEEAVIGAQRREWSRFVDDKNEFVNFNFKKVDDCVSLGDFASFTSFLSELIGDYPNANKN
ncbi:MAG: SIR2 family protein [Bacteroidales bacterium]|nr:SIR2 family protein [Bacteroidales bacterium]